MMIQALNLLILSLALYLISKTHLLVITLQSSSKSVRVHIVFIYRESNFCYITINHYSTYFDLSAFSTILKIGISFNLEYEINSFK
jgi:hypothetical protein